MNSARGFQISAKNLGVLALPNACERCFWLKAHAGRLPFQIFPGIFSSIDAYSKRVTGLHHAKFGQIPGWLGCGGVPVPVPHHTKFRVFDPQSGIVLTGVPDELLRSDEGLAILDYKTARFTDTQDELLPLYVAQINAYAFIAESLGMGPVVGMGLVYYEPVTDIGKGDLRRVLLKDGFKMAFKAKVLPVQRDEALIPGLLARAKAIVEQPAPQQAQGGCRDCEAVERLMGLLAGSVAQGHREAA